MYACYSKIEGIGDGIFVFQWLRRNYTVQKERFIEWLKENGVATYENYVSRLLKVEEIEGNLDAHYDKDKGASLLTKFKYTTADKLSEKAMKHQISIEPRDESERYESYYAGTNDYRSRITKYIEFREAIDNQHEQRELIEEVKRAVEKLQANNQLLPLKELQEGYERFSEKFSPAVLKGLDGEQLLNTLLNIGNREGMTYWLEFKNDDEFKTNAQSYGSISGGSSFKYILFNRNSDDQWVTGNPQNPTVLSVDQAIQLARDIRDALVAGASLIENLPKRATVQDYIQLQVQLETTLIHNMSNLGWVHKYYHMIYPDKIESFHSVSWQKHALISARILPVQEYKLYVLGGQLMQIVYETELPSSAVMIAMIEIFGAPLAYFRIGTSDSEQSYWPMMMKDSYIAIGWPELGDLNALPNPKSIRSDIEQKLMTHYNYNSNVASRKAGEVRRFFDHIKMGDIVVAVQGQKVLGIGQVSGEYEFIEHRAFPHCKAVEWLRIFEKPVSLPNRAEGKLSTCVPYRDLNNIFEIERLVLEKHDKNDENELKISKPLPILTGVQADVQNILKRKKQVILYGPPGTGKTYHGEHTCMELSARNLYGKTFDSLTAAEQTFIKGDGRTSGTVRMCCFHPSYGYEDFIEGIKPSVMNGQTVFALKDGIFKELCQDARKNPEKDYYLLIDEINRGDISRIFGELIMLIEGGKRGKSLTLSLSNKLFSVPPNVYIVGTMNTADRSIALLDVALRRRFGFIELMTDYRLFEGITYGGLPLDGWLKDLNHRIREHIGNEARNLQIGHSYFLENDRPIEDEQQFKSVIKEDIIPLIEEYCYSDYTLIEKILGKGIVDVQKQEIKMDLFQSSNIADLVTALLSQNPKLRVGTDVDDVSEEEHDEMEQEE